MALTEEQAQKLFDLAHSMAEAEIKCAMVAKYVNKAQAEFVDYLWSLQQGAPE